MLPQNQGEQHIAMLAKLLSDESCSLTTDLEYDALLESMDYHGVSALLANHASLPEQVRDALIIANLDLQQQALNQLLAEFKQRGLDQFLIFKGAALAHTVYSQPWLRPRGDCDILINKTNKAEFVAALQAAGFNSAFAITGDYVSYQQSFSRQLAGQSHLQIDLHWRINNRQCLANSYELTELIERGKQINFGEQSATIPDHIDSLLIAAIHRLGHHHREERLAWLYDIHLLANQLNQQQWHQLIDLVSEKQLAGICLDVLSTCQRLLATAVPQQTFEQLTTLSQRKEASALLLQRNLPEWRFFINDLRTLPNLNSRLGLLRETLFPSPDYIRQRMQTRSACWGYLKRAVRGFKRIT